LPDRDTIQGDNHWNGWQPSTPVLPSLGDLAKKSLSW